MATKAEKAARAARARALLFGDEAGADAPASTGETPPPTEAGASVSREGSEPSAAEPPATSTPEPEPLTYRVPESQYPKNHATPPPVGTPVYYKNERYFVECSPTDWSRGVNIRITDQRIRMPEGCHVSHSPLMGVISVYHAGKEQIGDERYSFFVHADLLTLAPVVTVKQELAGGVTKASLDRAAMRKAGQHDIGDEVAKLLREAGSLDGVYEVASKYLVESVTTLRKKYGHLNPGQQRMNLGNRMRSAWKKMHSR